MSKKWFVPSSSTILTLVSIGTLIVSCADDETGTGGCGGSCGHAWQVCQADLKSNSTEEPEFTNTCLETCRNKASSAARELGVDLNCVTQGKTCDDVRGCSTIGPLIPPANQGGFAGFSGGGGTGNSFNTGGFSTGGFFNTGGFSTGGRPGCSNDCFYAYNGICDDGDVGSSTSRCGSGTDCSDCGTRFGTGGSGGTGGFGTGGLGTGGGTAGCYDTCFYALNGTCEDGGPNSVSSLCVFGTDCADCGSRLGTGGTTGDGGTPDGSAGAAPDAGSLCTDSCVYSGNGSCDDGSNVASTGRCTYGTDCTDCGTQPFISNGSAGSPGIICSNTCNQSSSGTCQDDGTLCNWGTDCSDCGSRSSTTMGLYCTDACLYANNGICDDGGFNASFSRCTVGTDCSDCGPR